MFNLKNILINVDSYKISHWAQYPKNAHYINSYIESRGGDYNFTLFFGLQMFIKEYLLKPFTQKDIDEAEKFWAAHGEPFNKEAFEYILKVHGGLFPVKIQAVPEGSIIPNHNVLVQVINTDPNVPWVTSFIETALLRAVWYPTTVATRSKFIKNILSEFLEKTSDNSETHINFNLHDFGARGTSSAESAGIGGAAHLINFMGTDTALGALYAMEYYNTPEMPAFSIPAAEHSTITSWGREHEVDAYENMLNQFSGKGKIVAVVSDSYDLFNAIKNLWGGKLKEKVMNSGGTLVIRPDSGEPHIIVLKTVNLLGKIFGYTVNSKGYKVLPSYVKVIQGDGINERSVKKILTTLADSGYASDNVNFGMGGELLQNLNRDTLKFAMKASEMIDAEGNRHDVFKDPVTDSGKRSKKGRLALSKIDGQYITVRENELEGDNLLELIYENGRLYKDWTFSEIRNNSMK